MTPRCGKHAGLLAVVLAAVAIALVAGRTGADGARAADARSANRCSAHCVRRIRIRYRTHSGVRRVAWVLLPAWYDRQDHPRIPLVISPHGRGVSARVNARMWQRLPADGSFAVVNPQGEGRRLTLYSWGYSGQIADLARMPKIVERALPWVHVDRRRVYAVGTSMGGQETLLLVARYPRLLAGAAAFDSVTDLRQRFQAFTRLSCNRACRRAWTSPLGRAMRKLAREEVGGTPWARPRAYAVRSPISYAGTIAHAGVPLELWWSEADRIVMDPDSQSQKLLDWILASNPDAPVAGFVGHWSHSLEMRRLLVPALIDLGLLAPAYYERIDGIEQILPRTWPAPGCRRVASC
jgi:poly(3-hydroxybutyrate) depolymerase